MLTRAVSTGNLAEAFVEVRRNAPGGEGWARSKYEPMPLSINDEMEDILGDFGGAMLSVKDAVSHSLRCVHGSFPSVEQSNIQPHIPLSRLLDFSLYCWKDTPKQMKLLLR